MLSHLSASKKEKYSEMIQFRVSRTLKEQVFEILSERNIDLSTLLRFYLENVVKNYERSTTVKTRDSFRDLNNNTQVD